MIDMSKAIIKPVTCQVSIPVLLFVTMAVITVRTPFITCLLNTGIVSFTQLVEEVLAYALIGLQEHLISGWRCSFVFFIQVCMK